MKNIILTMLTTFVVAGCGGSSGDSGSTNADPDTGTVPISVDISTPPAEVPDDGDQLQACVAIDAVTMKDLAGRIVEMTTKSMNNPEEVSSEQCIPPDSSIPVDSDGYPKFIVLDLYDVTGVDLVNLLSEQLVPVGEYSAMGLSMLQGNYGDFFSTPYSYIGSLVDKQELEIVDELTFDGLNINIDAPETFTMSFDLRSMIQLIEDAYVMKNKGLHIVENTLAGSIFGDIDTSSCPVVDDAYVYLYESDSSDSTQYGDLGSEYAPVMTAKVTDDNTYSMPYVSEGSYDLVLVCDGLKDLPNQIDLDFDLDGDSQDQQVHSGEDTYVPL